MEKRRVRGGGRRVGRRKARIWPRRVGPAYAVVDMRLDDGNGLDVVPVLRETRPDVRVIMLTGYGNIATAVAAVKAGAVDYLAKPADADQIEAALLDHAGTLPPAAGKPHVRRPSAVGAHPARLRAVRPQRVRRRGPAAEDAPAHAAAHPQQGTRREG